MSDSSPTPAPPVDADIWILGGQSNMEGIGELSAALPPSEHVWSFTNAGRWEIATEPLHRFWESPFPIFANLLRPRLPEDRRGLSNTELARLADQERKSGTGLGLSFGREWFKATGKAVGLIPCAFGGSTQIQWDASLKSKSGESLYGAMLEQISRCGRRPRGLLWYQGESESWDLDQANRWGENFEKWMAQLRSDLNQPELPVVVVQIGRTVVPTTIEVAWNTVQLAQYHLPERIPNLAVTGSVDLPLIDGIHISAAGLIRLGARIAKVACSLIAGTPGVEIGPRLRIARVAKEGGGRLIDLEFTGVSGEWTLADNIPGFAVLDAAGNVHPTSHVINVFRHPGNKTALRVRLTAPLSAGEKLFYGHGRNSFCNLVDSADFPLLVSKIALD